MRAGAFIASAVVLAVVSLVAAAAGPAEQWLQYSSSDTPSGAVASTIGQELKLTDKAPPGLALPKFKSDKPLFALWKVKLDRPPARVAVDGGIWLALDQSRKDGPYDLLYADAKAEGTLADASPIKADASEEHPESSYAYARFLQVRFTLPGADGPAAYHAQFTYVHRGAERYVRVTSACWYEGQITIDGRKLWCLLADNNANTRFDDSGTSRDACDRIGVATAREKSSQYSATRYVGKHLQLDEKLYRVTIAPDGAFVQFAPAGPLPAGTIRVPDGVDEFAVFGPMGNFSCKPVAGSASMPAGKYMLDNWRQARNDAAGARWLIFDPGNTTVRPFTVEPNKEVVLDIGEPFVWEVSARRSGADYSINLIIRSRKGDYLRRKLGDEMPPQPRVRIRSADGKYDKTFDLAYG